MLQGPRGYFRYNFSQTGRKSGTASASSRHGAQPGEILERCLGRVVSQPAAPLAGQAIHLLAFSVRSPKDNGPGFNLSRASLRARASEPRARSSDGVLSLSGQNPAPKELRLTPFWCWVKDVGTPEFTRQRCGGFIRHEYWRIYFGPVPSSQCAQNSAKS